MNVNQRFPDIEHFKDPLRNFSIKWNFNFTFIKIDKQRMTVQYAMVGYQWCVHTSRADDTDMFRTKAMNPDKHPKMSAYYRRLLTFSGAYYASMESVCCLSKLTLGKEIARAILYGSEVGNYDLPVW